MAPWRSQRAHGYADGRESGPDRGGEEAAGP